GRCVLLQVRDHLVASRVAVGIAGEGESGEAVVATRGEEDERVPASAPGSADRIGCVEDQEVLALAGEEVADRQSRLTGADYHEVVTLILGRHEPASAGCG